MDIKNSQLKNCELDRSYLRHISSPILDRKFSFPGGQLFRVFITYRDRIAKRRAFAEMDEDQCRDVGLSKEFIDKEIAKPFWRA